MSHHQQHGPGHLASMGNSKQANNSCASSALLLSSSGGVLHHHHHQHHHINQHENDDEDTDPRLTQGQSFEPCSPDLTASPALVLRQDNQNAATNLASLSSAEALVRLLNRTLFPIVQENGQRRYGPPPDWKGESPARGCEVFIGKIPRDCFEDELVPVFERAGRIYMFRLMMDFTGTNRGYGFCVYRSREETRRAVQLLNNYEIRPEKALGVCLSVDNCRLFVGGIPKGKTREEIRAEMARVTEGVRDVIAYPSVADKTKNRGFAFVEYDSHKAAAMARRKLIPGRIQLWGQQIAVDWAEPEREVTEEVMSTVRILYVRNLMLSTTEDTLRDTFVCASSGPPDGVERVKKLKDYAFVHFKERCYADKAMRLINNTQIDGSWVEVSWAKPADKTTAAAATATTATQGGSDQKSRIGAGSCSQLAECLTPQELFPGAGPQIFMDSSTGTLTYISTVPLQTQPMMHPQSAALPCSPTRQKTGRRNAAGSRSVIARDRRPIETQLGDDGGSITYASGWPASTLMPKTEWDGYNLKYQCMPTQMLFPGMGYVQGLTQPAMSIQTPYEDALRPHENCQGSSDEPQLEHSVPAQSGSMHFSSGLEPCAAPFYYVGGPQYSGYTTSAPQHHPYLIPAATPAATPGYYPTAAAATAATTIPAPSGQEYDPCYIYHPLPISLLPYSLPPGHQLQQQ